MYDVYIYTFMQEFSFHLRLHGTLSLQLQANTLEFDFFFQIHEHNENTSLILKMSAT